MFADYDALKAAIISWADNDDVTARVDDFIALVHTRLNRKLRLEDMSELSTIPLTAGDPWAVKPPGYLGMRRLKLDGEPDGGLTYKTLSELDKHPYYNRQGMPDSYSVMADRIRLAPIPNAEWTLETLYWKRVDTLSAQVTTNVFLVEASDLLLYGALVEAEPFLKDNEMFATWKELFRQGLEDITGATEGERFPSGDLAMRAV